MSQRSDIGTQNDGTYQSALFAQCSRDDKLRSIFLHIHVMMWTRISDKQTLQSRGQKQKTEISNIIWRQSWPTKTATNWEGILSIIFFKNNKAETTDVFFKYGEIKARSRVLFLRSKAAGFVRHLKRRAMYIWKSSPAASFHEPTIADTALSRGIRTHEF